MGTEITSPHADTTPRAPDEDSALMRRVQNGDEAAQGALMERWERPVKAVIARLIFNARETEDLAQETFVRVWQQRARFNARAAFRPWVFAIAVNLARNRLRWWRRRPEVALETWTEPPGEELTGKHALESAERTLAVRNAIAALPAALREALVLFEYQQLSQSEIALIVGATPKAVETRIARARAHLREALRAWV